MAEIILVWNVHPNESEVTQEMAKLLKIGLGERGHEVKIVKFPDEATIHELVRQLPESKEYAKANIKVAEKKSIELIIDFLLDLKQKNPGAVTFELHCDNADINYKNGVFRKRRPKFWKAGKVTEIITPYPKNTPPFQLIHRVDFDSKLEGLYALEMPAVYRPAEADLLALIEKIPRVSGFGWGSKPHPLARSYFMRTADLKQTRAANYISPKTLAKITHLFDTTANTYLGRYRKPRGKPFRPKAKPPRKIRHGK